MRLRVRLVSLLLPAMLITAAPAFGSVYSRVLATYEQQGTIPPCTFSTPQLSAALRGVDVYGQQYFADFTAAIQTALAQRAAGACAHGSTAGAAAAGVFSPITARARRGQALPRGGVTAPTGAGLPAPLAVLAALAGLGLIALALAALARVRGWGAGVPGVWRHLWQEAAWRAGGVWHDFRDWVSVR